MSQTPHSKRPLQHPCPLPPIAHQAAADSAIIDEMLKAGIIEPSDSPWASGVVMVNKKKSAKMRFCVDYRPLNSVTRTHCPALMCGLSWFSSLDLRSGYWQPWGIEQLMENLLADIPLLVYLDDILVHRSSFQAALGALQRSGGEGISTLEKKVQAVRDWSGSTNLRELKSFIGLASYYRWFVHSFSCVAVPLFLLQQKDIDFSWTAECEQAFSSLKKALTEFPILIPPGARHANADAMSQHPCAPDSCRYCEKREAWEKELCVGEERGPTHDGDGPVCREVQVIDSPEWKTQQGAGC
ncbi:hypothetical protein L3Q82_000600 [Scortum barcoo]|uniref:Uncharacterized protein n=1 Tax=Scortum barcoo TaxID=214431 RepID=A0ACB8WF49_9TELE|nr:hypothetical protein L3Q82_000600 [Scortum barcoo]